MLNKNLTVSQVKRSGIVLRDKESSDAEWDNAFAIMKDWRDGFIFPLRTTSRTLSSRARKIDQSVIVSRRLKRLPSIVQKLKRSHNMKLNTMQDIGGCRAVLSSMEGVRRLAEFYRKSPLLGDEGRDYILSPKEDGYRSIHIVSRFNSSSGSLSGHNGKKIEIQLRTKIQHYWATALETVDLFDNQSLKFGRGSEDWKRFFILASCLFAFEEGTPLVSGVVPDQVAIAKELQDNLFAKLNFPSMFIGWNIVVSQVNSLTVDPNLNAALWLLHLDSSTHEMSLSTYSLDEVEQASTDYAELERKYQGERVHSVVLVAVDSIKALHSAYPNYFAETDAFIKSLYQCIMKAKKGEYGKKEI